MKILSISCSTSLGSVALLDQGDVSSFIKWSGQKSHSEHITKAIDDCLKSNLKDIDVIAVDIGPGSFTGIRVGLGAATTLAYAQDIPIYPCSSIKLLANQVKYNNPSYSGDIYVAQNAWSSKVFFGKYRLSNNSLQELIKPCLILESSTPSMLDTKESLLVSSDLFILENNKNFNYLHLHPSSDTLAKLAHNAEDAELSLWHKVRPLYLKGSSAEEAFR